MEGWGAWATGILDLPLGQRESGPFGLNHIIDQSLPWAGGWAPLQRSLSILLQETPSKTALATRALSPSWWAQPTSATYKPEQAKLPDHLSFARGPETVSNFPKAPSKAKTNPRVCLRVGRPESSPDDG